MPSSCPGCKDNRATDAGRGTQVDVWAIEDVIDRGYAVATFYCGDVAPDHPGFTDGVIPALPEAGRRRSPARTTGGRSPPGPGACTGRSITSRPTRTIDKARIAVVGHSRLGKAAIVAAAFDERIALAIPHQAGCGGTAPSRGKVGESVKRINTSFPHWFDAEFKTFNDQPERLPFDQNGLVALVAPRPVLFTNAIEDTWANPEGQFEVLKAADPVYRFLGAGGLDAESMPETGQAGRQHARLPHPPGQALDGPRGLEGLPRLRRQAPRKARRLPSDLENGINVPDFTALPAPPAIGPNPFPRLSAVLRRRAGWPRSTPIAGS